MKTESQHQEDNIIFTQITTNHKAAVEKPPSSHDLRECFPKPHNIKDTTLRTATARESSHKQRPGRLEGILIQTSSGSASFGETLLLIFLLSTFFPPLLWIFPALSASAAFAFPLFPAFSENQPGGIEVLKKKKKKCLIEERATDFIPKDRKKEAKKKKKSLHRQVVRRQRSHVALVLTNLVETGD